MYTQAFLKLKYLMEVKYKKLGELFMIVYNSKLLNVPKSLRINYNDLRVNFLPGRLDFIALVQKIVNKFMWLRLLTVFKAP